MRISDGLWRTTKDDLLQDVVSILPAETADLDYLINVELPKLSKRGVAALADALELVARDAALRAKV